MQFGFIGAGAMRGGLARNLIRAGKEVLEFGIKSKVRGRWIAAGDFGSRFGLDLVLEDVRLGYEMPDIWGINPKIMKAALERFKKASKEGLGSENCSTIYKIIK